MYGSIVSSAARIFFKITLIIICLMVVLASLRVLASEPRESSPATLLAQTTYYVSSSSGVDTNSGLTAAEAWQSLDRLTSADLQPGDNVLFACGELFTSGSDTLTLAASGTSTLPITLATYPADCGTSRPRLENVNATVNYSSVLNITGNYWNIRNLAIINSSPTNLTETGITLAGNNNIVSNVDISGTGFGVKILGNNNQLLNSGIHGLVMLVNDTAPDNDYGVQGVLVSGASNTKILGNRFYNLSKPSYDYGQDGSALEIYKSVYGLEFAYNRVENAEALTEIGSDNSSDLAQNINLHHNLVINANTLGIFHNNTSSNWNIGLANITLDNNTFVRNLGQVSGTTFWFAAPPSTGIVFLRNNIFDYRNLQWWSINMGNTVRQNNLYNLQGIQDGWAGDTTNPNYALGSGEIKSAPGFVNATAGDYSLASGSAAIDAGQNLDYSRDFVGTAVPQGSSADIGAFEFFSPVVITLPTANFTASPVLGTSPLVVAFIDQSINNPTTWAWDFDNDGQIDSTEQNPTYTYIQPGTYSVSLRVSNVDGSDTLLRSDYIFVNAAPTNQPPVANAGSDQTFTVTSGQTVSVTLNGTQSFDPDGTIAGYIWLDSQGNQVGNQAQITLNLGVGQHSFRLRVTDNQGATAEDTVLITITQANPPTNQLPQVNIISPTNNQTFLPNQSLTLTASASDSDGTVNQVNFYLNGSLVGSGTFGTQGWTYNLSGLNAGNYTLYAIAIDNQGGQSQSPTINFRVQASAVISPILPITGGFSVSPAGLILPLLMALHGLFCLAPDKSKEASLKN